MNEIQIGSRVLVVLPEDAPLRGTQWYPKGEVTGEVQRIFKNGTAAVAIDQIRNSSADGRHELHLRLEYLVLENVDDYDGSEGTWHCDHDVPGGCPDCATVRREAEFLDHATDQERSDYLYDGGTFETFFAPYGPAWQQDQKERMDLR